MDVVTVTRDINADRESVYQALVSSEDFAYWFGTDSVPVLITKWDAREGGEWAAVMQLPGGETKSWVGGFKTLSPSQEVVYTLTDDVDHPEDQTELRATVDDVDGGTRLTLSQPVEGWPEEAKAGLTAGYNAFIDSLERLFDDSDLDEK